MALNFEWDAAKATENVSKHGVSFEEASTCFSDLEALVIFDVVLEPDVAREFPDAAAVNQALRDFLRARKDSAGKAS